MKNKPLLVKLELEEPLTSVEEKIAAEILKDISDRRGLKHTWADIDMDIQQEILETWKKLIKRHLPKQKK